jgi:hypothetical protein
MPETGFESMIHVFKRAMAVHALDPAAAVIGQVNPLRLQGCNLGKPGLLAGGQGIAARYVKSVNSHAVKQYNLK